LPARGDAADRNDAREAVDGSQAGVAHDGCPARFAPVVGGRLDRLDGTALAGAGKLRDHDLEQRSTVGLDRQRVVATASSTVLAIARWQCSASAVTMQPSRDSSDKTSTLPWSRCGQEPSAGQRHARFHGKDVDQSSGS